jgi:hypothetical protein
MAVEPTTVRLQGRDVTVERVPLKPRVSGSMRTVTLLQPRPGCLVLRASLALRLFAGICMATGLPCALLLGGIFFDVGGVPALFRYFLLVFCLAFAAVGVLLFIAAGRYEFDRDAGELKWHCCGMVWRRPLSDILALQILHGGHHRGNNEGYDSWQLNLILDDEARPRWNLSDHGSLKATRRHAERLAEFLGVPALDHLPDWTTSPFWLGS